MLFAALKFGLFGVGWLLGRVAVRAARRAGALDTRLARGVLRAALAFALWLYWYPEIAWSVRNPAEVARAIGFLGLTAVPVAGFVLFLRWAHRRAGQSGTDP